jgi:hypothetical protein
MFDPDRAQLPPVRTRKVTTKALQNTTPKKAKAVIPQSAVNRQKRGLDEEDTWGNQTSKRVKVNEKRATASKPKRKAKGKTRG